MYIDFDALVFDTAIPEIFNFKRCLNASLILIANPDVEDNNGNTISFNPKTKLINNWEFGDALRRKSLCIFPEKITNSSIKGRKRYNFETSKGRNLKI